MQRAHVIYDREQGRWLALALMPTGDPRITVTRWTYNKDKAFTFGSLKAARNMLAALGGCEFEIQKKD